MTSNNFSFQVGNIECTALLDNERIMTVARVLRGFPDADEAAYRQAYADIGLSLDAADLSANVLLAKIGKETVLIDAGEAGKPNGGLLPKSMKDANIDPESISLVVITHTHGDHVQGLLTDDNQAFFPNARYVMSKIELDFWQDNIDNGRAEHGAIVSMMQEKGLRLIEMDEPIIEGLTAISLEGHTPGQMGLFLESDGEALLHLADLLHIPIQFAHPEWSAVFDNDTSVSVPTRRRMLQYAADNNLQTFFYHLTFPGLGHIEESDNRFVWKPQSTS